MVLPDTAIVGDPGHVTDHNTIVAAVAELQDSAPFYSLNTAAGVDPTGVTECAAAINAAILSAAAAGLRVHASGTYKIASTVTIASNADLGDATFNYTAATGVAVRVGTPVTGDDPYISWLNVTTPHVLASAKTTVGDGWSEVVGTVGVEIANVYSSIIVVPEITNFETGLKCIGRGSGFAYNEVHPVALDNNKINMYLTADATGWCNENVFICGRLSQNSGEGFETVGSSHIKMDVCPNPINNNTFLTASVEGNIPEYHLIGAGTLNKFLQLRWETYSGISPKVLWKTASQDNLIDGGYGANAIVETFEVGADGTNDIRGELTNYTTKGSSTGIYILENTFSADAPAIIIRRPGSRAAQENPATSYCLSQTALNTRLKRNTDVSPRIRLNHSDGSISLGDGTAEPTAFLGGSPGLLHVTGANVAFLEDNTRDIGTNAYRPRDLKLGRDAVIGGALDHNGTTVGFYGTAPIAKQTGVAVSVAAIHAALVNLGLIT